MCPNLSHSPLYQKDNEISRTLSVYSIGCLIYTAVKLFIDIFLVLSIKWCLCSLLARCLSAVSICFFHLFISDSAALGSNK